jgi:hypothetical protein
MQLSFDGVQAGQQVVIRLASGALCQGLVESCDGGWMRLRTALGISFVQLTHVAVISLGGDVVDEALPKPVSNDVPRKSGSRAPGRPWAEDDLRQLADGFLDGSNDAELAERFHRTRGAIKEMHQGFEAARGNLVDDQVSPVARTWIPRWRRVLAG